MQPNEITARETRARQLHQQGYNCCQSVVMAFADLLPIPAEQALAMAAPFGRGLSGLKQTCGCVNGMAMVCGLCGQPQAVRPLGQRFQEEHGELNCFRLLQQQGQDHSCNDLVASAARLLAEVL